MELHGQSSQILYTSFIFVTFASLPIATTFYFSDEILKYFTDDLELVTQVAKYTQNVIPAIFLYVFQNAFNQYLNAIGYENLTKMESVMPMIFYPIKAYLLIVYYDEKLVGAAYALCIYFVFKVNLIIIYLVCLKKVRSNFRAPTLQCISLLKTYACCAFSNNYIDELF